jgi:ABC-type antimicrobial peptide transport system permease subunit
VKPDPAVDLLRTLSLRRHVEGVFFPQRLASGLLLLLGAVSFSLAALGVYGVTAFAVTQRTPEFGVRAALGATAMDVGWLVLRETLVLTATGAAIGLVLSLGLTRLVASFLNGVSPFDPLTYTAVPVFLTLVAVLASAMPARRAARVDPVSRLRVVSPPDGRITAAAIRPGRGSGRRLRAGTRRSASVNTGSARSSPA